MRAPMPRCSGQVPLGCANSAVVGNDEDETTILSGDKCVDARGNACRVSTDRGNVSACPAVCACVRAANKTSSTGSLSAVSIAGIYPSRDETCVGSLGRGVCGVDALRFCLSLCLCTTAGESRQTESWWMRLQWPLLVRELGQTCSSKEAMSKDSLGWEGTTRGGVVSLSAGRASQSPRSPARMYARRVYD